MLIDHTRLVVAVYIYSREAQLLLW